MTWLTGRDGLTALAVVRLIAPAVIGALIALGLVDADAVCDRAGGPLVSSSKSPVVQPALPAPAQPSE